ncbi:molecular chaperone DnaJ, partial [bacterium]|nr:molecular chaperone DnaJ [bacterium]
MRDWGWHAPSRGRDIEYGLEITLEEAASGLEKIISVPHIENCDKCGGSGAKEGTSPKTCSKCNGSGQISYSRSVGGNSYVSFTQIVPCSKCRGEGAIIEDPCRECNGKGKVQREHRLRVKIPPGVESGGILRLRGEGDVGEKGTPAGDLYVSVNIKPHEIFQRRGNDLICEIPITFPQASLGAKIKVPTLDGQAQLKI